MKHKKFLFAMSVIGTLSFSGLVFAAPDDFKELIEGLVIDGLIKPIVPLLIGLAVLVFIWGVFKYVFAKGGEDKEDGKSFMMWGIIGLFAMISVWGVVNVLRETFNLNEKAPAQIKIVPPKI